MVHHSVGAQAGVGRLVVHSEAQASAEGLSVQPLAERVLHVSRTHPHRLVLKALLCARTRHPLSRPETLPVVSRKPRLQWTRTLPLVGHTRHLRSQVGVASEAEVEVNAAVV